jgi:putative chitinase
MITREQLVKVLSKNGKQVVRDGLVDGLLKTMDKYEISDNDYRIAMFLAQVAHESGGFKYMVESINMSAKRIRQVWPSRFPTEESAMPYANNPQKLANKVYASRMGNGDEASGDGYRYRGRGLIQVTGKSNYTSFARSQNIALQDVISYLETDEGASESAGWFWNSRNLNPLADIEDVEKVSRKINGGTVGLEDRILLYENFKKRLADLRVEETPPEEIVPEVNKDDGEPTF